MRIAVIGASGNVGTSVLDALAQDDDVTSVLALCRRPPRDNHWPKAEWRAADVVTDDLMPLLRGADAAVHLAWAIQPSRDERLMHEINVVGSVRVFEAVAAAGVPALVYASSVGAYSPGPKELVDESWPTHGIPTATYSRHKAYVERVLDAFELRHPHVRVVRLRPALIFKRGAASEVRRLFMGPLVPSALLRPGRIPLVPDVPALQFQCVHSLDVGEAYRLACKDDDARGAFNIAADPVIDPARLAQALGARTVPVPAALARAAAGLTWRMNVQPTPEGWVDLALSSPLLDASRARLELGWAPRHDAIAALRELLGGVADRAGADTPALDPDAGGPGRVKEFATGVGRSQ